MSTQPHPTPVILVVLNGNTVPDETLSLINFYNSETPIPLVLLQEYSDGNIPGVIDWDSVIVNSADKDHATFRVNALSILREHSNMLPIAVIEGNRRYERIWDLPVLKYGSEL